MCGSYSYKYFNYLTAFKKSDNSLTNFKFYWAPYDFINRSEKIVTGWKHTTSIPTGFTMNREVLLNNDLYVWTQSGSTGTKTSQLMFTANFVQPTPNMVQISEPLQASVMLQTPLEYTTSLRYNDLASVIGLTANKIKAGETILGVTGTYSGNVLLFETVTQMEAYQNPTTNQLAVVYGTTYIGTYRYNGTNWIQIGDSTENQQTMSTLNEVMNTPSDPYDGNGGTDQEIEDVLDDILGN